MKMHLSKDTMRWIVPLTTLLQLCALAISSASAITRSDLNSVHRTVINGSATTGHPHPQFFYPQSHPHLSTPVAGEVDDRIARQWLSGGYASPYGMSSWGGAEVLMTTLLVILGIGVIGLPFLLLIFSAFNGNQGLNFMAPATTTVAGRKRREALFSSSVNPLIQSKLVDIMKKFSTAPDKMTLLYNLLDD